MNPEIKTMAIPRTDIDLLESTFEELDIKYKRNPSVLPRIHPLHDDCVMTYQNEFSGTVYYFKKDKLTDWRAWSE